MRKFSEKYAVEVLPVGLSDKQASQSVVHHAAFQSAIIREKIKLKKVKIVK